MEYLQGLKLDKFKIIRVFIGSPGGLTDEREAALKVIEEVNLANSEHWQCHFKLFGWENTIPGYVRPQSKINEDLDKCNYFIGVLWNRWGSTPSLDPDGHTSGFEEEFVRAETRIKAGLMKDLALYFKNVDAPIGYKPDEEMEKVIKFRQKCIDEKRTFFKDFSDANEFRDLVRKKLNEIGWLETEILTSGDQKNNPSEQSTPPAVGAVETSAASDSHLFDPQAISFLSEMCKRSADWEQTQAFDVARFRLIGSALSRSGNDDRTIGNHDANLMYRFAPDNLLSKQEVRALADCGIVGFENQNVPLWRWLAALEEEAGDPLARVRWHAIVGDKQEKKQAVKILDCAAQPIPTMGELGKKDTLDIWLTVESDESAFAGTLQFLANNADETDIPLIEAAAVSIAPGRKERLEAAIVAVLARSSVNVAIDRVLSSGIGLLDVEVVTSLFASPESLDTDKLTVCLSAKPDNLRIEAAKLLFKRDEISVEQAQGMVADSTLEIRFIASEVLYKLGQPLSDDLLKKALTIERQPNAPLFNAFARRETDSTFFDRYQSNRLSEMSLAQLKTEVAKRGVLASRDLAAMYKAFSRILAPEIRLNLQDGFKAFFENDLAAMDRASGPSETRTAKMRDLEEFLRNSNSTRALEALCGLGKKEDLPLVRHVIDTMKVDASNAVLNYLTKFGQWVDVERIKTLGDLNESRSGIFDFRSPNMPAQKAAAIIAVGESRIADVLNLSLDSSVRRAVARQLPQTVIMKLSDDLLITQLNNEDEKYRVIFALKCVLALSKQRLKGLLEKYLGVDEKLYYNSTHWLDLGKSMPTALARTIARRQLLSFN